MRQKGLTVVDPDSVNAALAVSRVRGDVEKALRPDILVTPTFVGNGERMSVLVTIRDTRSSASHNSRIAAASFAPANPAPSIPGLVRSVIGQIESLTSTPTFIRVKSIAPIPGSKQR